MPEVLGEAGSYFNPNDVNSICVAITEVLKEKTLRDEMGQRASLRAKQFSWGKTKELTIKNLFEAASIEYPEIT